MVKINTDLPSIFCRKQLEKRTGIQSHKQARLFKFHVISSNDNWLLSPEVSPD